MFQRIVKTDKVDKNNITNNIPTINPSNQNNRYSHYRNKSLNINMNIKYNNSTNINNKNIYLPTISRQRSISEISNDYLSTFQNKRMNYIDTMASSGNFFEYDLSPPHIGTHRAHLGEMEDITRNKKKIFDIELQKFIALQRQCINFRTEMKDEYRKLRNDLQDEMNFLQVKIHNNLNRVKVENLDNQTKLKNTINELKQTKQLFLELKERVNKLKLKIDGEKMYNKDGIPVLNTKI